MTLRLPCALDRAQVGPERFGSKGTNHNSYRSIQLNAGRREVSIRRFRQARAVLAACGVLADGNRVLVHTWHRGPRRTRQGCRKSFQDPRQRGLPDRLAPRGSKGPEEGRFGGRGWAFKRLVFGRLGGPGFIVGPGLTYSQRS